MTARVSRFERGSSTYRCESCGKLTRNTGDEGDFGRRSCRKCWDEAGFENEHQDGGHDPGSRPDCCPMCRPAAVQP